MQNSFVDIVIICDAGMRYKYPHPLDLAELLSHDLYSVTVLGPKDAKVVEWNKNRGFSIEEVVPQKGKLKDFLAWLGVVKKKYKGAKVLIPFTTKSLAIAIFIKLFVNFRVKIIYYALELEIPFKGSGGYSFFQYFIRLTCNKVVTTGEARAKILMNSFFLKEKPDVVLNAALCNPIVKGVVNIGLLDLLKEKLGRLPKYVIVVNGGLSSLNQFFELIEASIMWKTEAVLALVGTLDSNTKNILDNQYASGRNKSYCYLGEFIGNRASLIGFIKGAHLGVAFKKMDKNQMLNDQFYTPNKFFDYVAAAIPVLCTNNPELSLLVDDSIGFLVDSSSAENIAKAVDSFFSESYDLVNYKENVNEVYQSKYNYEYQTNSLGRFINTIANG